MNINLTWLARGYRSLSRQQASLLRLQIEGQSELNFADISPQGKLFQEPRLGKSVLFITRLS